MILAKLVYKMNIETDHMIESSQVDEPLGSVLHGEVGLVAHHVVDEVEAVGRQGGGEHVLVVGRLQHHCHRQSSSSSSSSSQGGANNWTSLSNAAFNGLMFIIIF